MLRQICFAGALYCAAALAMPANAASFEMISVSDVYGEASGNRIAAPGDNGGLLPAQFYSFSADRALGLDFDRVILVTDGGANIALEEASVIDGDAETLASADGAFLPDIPEPTTWAMLAFGLGLLGVGLRRSQRTAIQFS